MVMTTSRQRNIMKSRKPVPEFIDPVFTKTSPKRSFSVIQNERFGLVFAGTGSIISGTGEVHFYYYNNCSFLSKYLNYISWPGSIKGTVRPGWICMRMVSLKSPLKVVGNEKVGGSGMCQSVSIRLGPRRWRCVSLSILLLPLILSISVSSPVKQNEQAMSYWIGKTLQ